jgi:hypothetical protein
MLSCCCFLLLVCPPDSTRGPDADSIYRLPDERQYKFIYDLPSLRFGKEPATMNQEPVRARIRALLHIVRHVGGVYNLPLV